MGCGSSTATRRRRTSTHAEIEVTLALSGPRYVSPDLEFAVWSATRGERSDGEELTLTGPLGHAGAGDQLVCAGAFSEHKRYGWQFTVETFRSALPRSAEGVVRWLTTRVPGIGPVFARAIVAHFGADEVFAELDRNPERLREVRTRSGRKISQKSIERAIDAWREVATIREVETFLFSHGISAGLAGRLVRTFGDEVVAVLEHDPYRLIELPGVGFTIADRIARSLGVEPDAPQRLRAGLQFVLEGAEADGNTFLPLAELWPRAGKLLEVADVEPIESAVRALAAEGEVVVEDDRIYRTELWEMERRLARLLARRAAAEPDELFSAESRPKELVSEEQWAVVELVRTRSLVLLTGLPGAGKTHTQRVLVDVARRARRRVLLCAPTGKAARRMRDLTGHEAMTIHRALGYSPIEGFQRDEDDPLSKSYDLIIVDEASMLSLELADAFFRAAGDCHVLLVGDTDQLPPIGAGRVLADLVDSRRGTARPPDRDLPAGSTVAHRAQRTPDQRRRAAVPLARRRARVARRGRRARRGLLLRREAGAGGDARRGARPRVRADPGALRPRRAHRRDDARADAPRRRRAHRAQRGARAPPEPRRGAGRPRARGDPRRARASCRRRTTTRPTAR